MESRAATKTTPPGGGPIQSADSPEQGTRGLPARQSRLRTHVVAALCVVGLVLGYLFFAPFGKSSWEPETTRPVASESVKVVGEGLIQIQTGHVIEQKLQVGVVEKSRISVPLLTV